MALSRDLKLYGIVTIRSIKPKVLSENYIRFVKSTYLVSSLTLILKRFHGFLFVKENPKLVISKGEVCWFNLMGWC
ncbi:hypothetical protein Hanom_Chr10g00919411 [Helianthus anomalus]